MYEIKEVKHSNKDFINLCKKIDEYQNDLIPLRKNWGFSSLDEIDVLDKILLMYDNEKAVASASIRKVDNNTAELCSIYTEEEYRNKGICTLLINELIKYLASNNYKKLILYTLKGSIPAISLYNKLGFVEINIEEKKEDMDHMSYLNNDTLEEIDKYTVYMEKKL